jgi:hypothetical protein
MEVSTPDAPVIKGVARMSAETLLPYWIATVTGTLDILPAVRTTGTVSEAAIPAGTVTFIWYRPTNRQTGL